MRAKLKVAVQWLWEDLRRAPWHFVVNVVAASCLAPRPVRFLLYRLCGLRVDTAGVLPGQYFWGKHVRIGKGAFINHNCFFDNNEAAIEVGEHTGIGAGTIILTGAHPIDPGIRRWGPVQGAPVKIGKGCWVGARVTILPGITVGDGCVIGTGAVVTRDCEPNGVYVGVPARRIRDLGGDRYAKTDCVADGVDAYGGVNAGCGAE